MGQRLSDGLGGSLSGTLAYLRSKMGGSSDVVIRRLQNRGPEGEDIAICYVGGLIDQMLLSELIDDLDKRFLLRIGTISTGRSPNKSVPET